MIKSKKIILAAGVFPPDIGGPATFAKLLAEELPKHNCETAVVTYGDKRPEPADYKLYLINREQNIFFRYIKYFWHIYKLSKEAGVIYALDLMSVGLPCALVKLLRSKIKFVVRLGGDFLWEKAAQEKGYDNTLRQYYADKKFNFKEKIIFAISKFVLKRADKIIFNSFFLKDIYVRQKIASEDKAVIIKNIKPEVLPPKSASVKKDFISIIFAGRIIAVRNLKRLIDALNIVKRKNWLKDIILEIIGEGPEKDNLQFIINNLQITNSVKFYPRLSREDLLKKINNSDIVAVISLTDINPNFASEALELGKPVILTKESEFYYVDDKNPLIYYVNPLNVDDIAGKMENVLNDVLSGKIQPAMAKTGDESWNIDEVVKKHMEIFNL